MPDWDEHANALTDLVQQVLEAGGFSVTRELEPAPPTGYYVSEEGGRVIPADLFGPDDIRDMQSKVGPDYIGGWLDDGQVYLDKTKRFEDVDDAMAFGQEHNQKAIYDANTGQVLDVPPKVPVAPPNALPPLPGVITPDQHHSAEKAVQSAAPMDKKMVDLIQAGWVTDEELLAEGYTPEQIAQAKGEQVDPNIMYHVAAPENEASILQHGLDHSHGGGEWREFGDHGNLPHGNYLWHSQPEAASYAEPGQHIWKVDVSGLNPQPDPAEPAAYYVPATIPPERMQRVAAVDPEWAQPWNDKRRIPWVVDEAGEPYLGLPGEGHSNLTMNQEHEGHHRHGCGVISNGQIEAYDFGGPEATARAEAALPRVIQLYNRRRLQDPSLPSYNPDPVPGVTPEKLPADVEWKLAAYETDPKMQAFFEQAGQGLRAPERPLGPEDLPTRPDDRAFRQTWEQYAGPFDRHIETSIPGYATNMARKGVALSTAFPGASLLDMAAGHGSFGKALAAHGMKTMSVDAAPHFQQSFESTPPVEGAQFGLYSLTEPFTDANGNHILQYPQGTKHDIVHEAMGFQFYSQDRARDVEQAKSHLNPGGLAIFDEKFRDDQNPQAEQANEHVKDAWKLKHFTPEALRDKEQEVGLTDQWSTGMRSMQADITAMQDILARNFQHVAPYWKSGNFAGFAASDDPQTLQRFLSSYGNATTPVTSAYENGGGIVPLDYEEGDGPEPEYRCPSCGEVGPNRMHDPYDKARYFSCSVCGVATPKDRVGDPVPFEEHGWAGRHVGLYHIPSDTLYTAPESEHHGWIKNHPEGPGAEWNDLIPVEHEDKAWRILHPITPQPMIDKMRMVFDDPIRGIDNRVPEPTNYNWKLAHPSDTDDTDWGHANAPERVDPDIINGTGKYQYGGGRFNYLDRIPYTILNNGRILIGKFGQFHSEIMPQNADWRDPGSRSMVRGGIYPRGGKWVHAIYTNEGTKMQPTWPGQQGILAPTGFWDEDSGQRQPADTGERLAVDPDSVTRMLSEEFGRPLELSTEGNEYASSGWGWKAGDPSNFDWSKPAAPPKMAAYKPMPAPKLSYDWSTPPEVGAPGNSAPWYLHPEHGPVVGDWHNTHNEIGWEGNMQRGDVLRSGKINFYPKVTFDRDAAKYHQTFPTAEEKLALADIVGPAVEQRHGIRGYWAPNPLIKNADYDWTPASPDEYAPGSNWKFMWHIPTQRFHMWPTNGYGMHGEPHHFQMAEQLGHPDPSPPDPYARRRYDDYVQGHAARNEDGVYVQVYDRGHVMPDVIRHTQEQAKQWLLRNNLPFAGHLGKVKQAMPYHNNTWYHVTPTSYLPSIAEKGLLPQTMGSSQPNWPAIERHNDAVYLHQNLDSAQQMANMARRSREHSGWSRDEQGRDQFTPGIPNWPQINGKPDEPAILRVRGLDRDQIVPDAEDFGHQIERWMQDENDLGDAPDEMKPILDEWRPANNDESWGEPSTGETIDVLHHLHENHPDFLRGVTRGMADDEGSRMMTLGGPVHPDQIEHVHLPSQEDWYEGFQPSDEAQRALENDDYDLHDQEQDDWMLNNEHTQPPDWAEIHQKYLDDPESGADDAYAPMAQYTPLREYVQRKWPRLAMDFNEPRPPERPQFNQGAGDVKFIHIPATGQTHFWQYGDINPDPHHHDRALQLGASDPNHAFRTGEMIPGAVEWWNNVVGEPQMAVTQAYGNMNNIKTEQAAIYNNFRNQYPEAVQAYEQHVRDNPEWYGRHTPEWMHEIVAKTAFDWNTPKPSNAGWYKFVYHKPTGQFRFWGDDDVNSSGAYNEYHHGAVMDEMGIPEEEQFGPNTVPGYADFHYDEDGTPYLSLEDARNPGAHENDLDPDAAALVEDELRKRHPEMMAKLNGERTAASLEYPLLGGPGWRGGIPQATIRHLVDVHGPNEFFGHDTDCINPKCQHHWTPEEQQELTQYGEITCPVCHTQQTIQGNLGGYFEPMDDVGPSRGAPGNRVPGGNTRAGLSLKEMGDIGEKLVERLNVLPCGAITHHFGTEVYNNPIDFTTVDEHNNPWGVEVKTIDSRVTPRFKMGGAAEVAGKRDYCAKRGLRPALVGVRLNFATDTADIYFRPQFTDPYLSTMTHVGTLNFADLNPYRDPASGAHEQAPVPQDIPF